MALSSGALLGHVAYGAYELVNWTVMRRWHPSMVALDMAWGTALSAVSAWGGVLAAQAFAA